MATGDIIEVVIKGEHDGQETNNVLHFKLNSGDEDEGGVADAVKECIVDSLLAALSGEWTGKGVYAKKIYPTTSVEQISSLIGEDGEGGAGLPSFNAALFSLRTAHAGKSGQGRMFVPGIPEASQVGSVLEASAITALSAFVTCMVGKFITGTFAADWGVVSRKNKAATPGTVANWFFPLTEVVVNPDIASMRSRKKGRGI